MKSFNQFISEVKQTVKDWQSGVLTSNLAGTPDPARFENPNFQAGYQAGMRIGPKAIDPSYRAKRVKKQAAVMAKNRGCSDCGEQA